MTQAQILQGGTSEHGRSWDWMRCACGALHRVFWWSWAGHGYKVCRSCKGHISYGTLEVKFPIVKVRIVTFEPKFKQRTFKNIEQAQAYMDTLKASLRMQGLIAWSNGEVFTWYDSVVAGARKGFMKNFLNDYNYSQSHGSPGLASLRNILENCKGIGDAQ